MRRIFKKAGSICAIFFFLATGYLFLASRSADALTNDYCAFCDPVVLNNQKFYEDDLVFALYTHKPVFAGHCLVIPKRHSERFEGLSDSEAMQINRVIKKVNMAASKVFGTSSYLILQKNGAEVGQTVLHVHFHYIPRKAGDNSTLKFMSKMYLTNMQKPIKQSEMDQVITKMKEAME